jgi:hypothetical protein
MNIEELFDFDYIESEGYWSVTHYYGRGEEVVLPVSYKDIPVKAIGDWFSPYNKRIKRVTIPEGYTSIGEQAFEGCTMLTKINFPETLTSIGERAFNYCILLSEIKLPKSLTSVGVYAFSSCIGLTKIKFPEGLTSIWKYAFQNCSGFTDIEFPESITSIEESAFSFCSGLTDIKLPERLASIGVGAFAYCTKLKDIKLPVSLTSIEPSAFNYCTGLTNIKIPENLTSIGSGVFEGCTELAQVNVDENNPVFCSVDGVMFDKTMNTLICFPEGKKGVYSIPEGIISIGSGVFNNCKLTGISFPQSLFSFWISWFTCEQLTDITVNEHHLNYFSIDGVLFDKKKSELIKYPKNKDKTDYTVPDGIISISSRAFENCKHMVNIVLPENLEIIKSYAFNGCEGLKAITLPVNLQYVGECVFINCPNLETVTLSRKTRIVYGAFEGFKGKLIYRD